MTVRVIFDFGFDLDEGGGDGDRERGFFPFGFELGDGDLVRFVFPFGDGDRERGFFRFSASRENMFSSPLLSDSGLFFDVVISDPMLPPLINDLIRDTNPPLFSRV